MTRNTFRSILPPNFSTVRTTSPEPDLQPTSARSDQASTIDEERGFYDSGDDTSNPVRPSDHDCEHSTTHPLIRPLARYTSKAQARARQFIASPVGQSVLKCSLAYLIASLATFVPPIGSLIGRGDGKHVVATVTVYFHPARSAGSMVEAIGLASLSFLYTTLVTVTSSAVSAVFRQNGMLYLGYAVILLLFCGGGLGVIGWVKQKFQDPLINVACSLASMAIVTILTKEGHVQSGVFSVDKILQVLKMIIMGITTSALVCFFIKPIYARHEMRNHLVAATNSLKTMMTVIMHDFSRGSTSELSTKTLQDASNCFKKALASLKKYQNEAKYEHYALGTVREHRLYGYLIDSIETLGQDLGGLRSASTMLIDLLDQKDATAPSDPVKAEHYGTHAGLSHRSSLQSLVFLPQSPPTTGHLSGLLETAQSQGVIPSPVTVSGDSPVGGPFSPSTHVPLSPIQGQSAGLHSSVSRGVDQSSHSAHDPAAQVVYLIPNGSDHEFVFDFFVSHLGPPMTSLARTMRLILKELPCGSAPDHTVAVDPHFSPSLLDALNLFKASRSTALDRLRQHKLPHQSRTIEAVADYEEVAAGCGHFSTSLEDFAEDLGLFIDILERITTVQNGKEKKSWDWLKFWRFGRITLTEDDRLAERLIVPPSRPWKSKTNALPRKGKSARYRDTDGRLARNFATFRYRLWQALRFFRRDDIKYAFKVGIGAIIYAVWSFIPATRPIYAHFRGEWGLVSYMLVCSMMVGSSNTTASLRILGTLSGAGIAIGIWTISHEIPLVLALFGWMVSLVCFYVILGMDQGPVGRYVLLTYNLSALYAYSLTISDRDDDNDDEVDSSKAAIVEIVFHRVVSVIVGCLWGIVITRLLWPIRARRKLRDGLAVLWLRISMLWKPDPLEALLSPAWIANDMSNPLSPVSLTLTESIRLQRHLDRLETIRAAACNEITLKGPFRDDVYTKLLRHSSRIVDAFYALNVLLMPRRRATTSKGEMWLLDFTRSERAQLSTRISHLFSVLASSILLGYPSLASEMPRISSSRDRLLARLYQSRFNNSSSSSSTSSHDKAPQKAEDRDFETYYAYSLITGQLEGDLRVVTDCLGELFGEFDQETIVLWD